MKKIIAAGLLLLSGSAFSAQMECMVDTAAYDEWSVGQCMSFEYTMDYAPNDAIWRITNLTKPVSSVIWSEKNNWLRFNSYLLYQSNKALYFPFR